MKISTQDKRELLSEFLSAPGFVIFLSEIESRVKDIEANILRYDLGGGDRGLALEKARGEGARKLLSEIKKIKKSDSGT
jgi:hypothetical protein